jgi:CheY-like chemotaxis protein
MSKTVLVVDDSARMRLTVRLMLEGRNAELDIQEAVDGLDAIEKAENLKPDLIVLDLVMPRLNGAEAASVLKKAMPDTPIVLFTLYNDIGPFISSASGVEMISKTDGLPRLLERVDTLFASSAEVKEHKG